MLRTSAALLFFLSISGNPVSAAAPTIEPFEANSVISGRLTQDGECAVQSGRKNAQVWVSLGQILLYQVEVPPQGSYEFHVTPGKYDVVATNSKGCLTQTQIQVAPKQVAQVELKLEPSRGPATYKNGRGGK